ncbi:MAG: hypothetical protein MJ211_02510 [Bacteroidales bacterium]|nr:hypothetical protein [Bacteroidales bacterium]
MKKYLLLLSTTLLLYQIAVGQNNINPNGYNTFYYPEGGISSEGTLKDGKPDGFWKTYYPNGKLKSAGNRSNFQLDSTWIFFDETGDTTSIINYNYDKKNGYQITYTSFNDTIHHNIPSTKELYVNDKRQGNSITYFKNGQIENQIPYKDDYKQGTGYQFNKDGVVIAILQYKQNRLVDKNIINRIDDKGNRQGLWQTFYPDFQVKTECYYKDDKLNGYKREFDTKGKEISIERYINGEIQKEEKNKLSSSSKESVTLKNDYYSDGTIKSSGGFKNDKPVGIHRTYNEKGKIKSSSTYDDNGVKIADGIVDGKGREQGKWTLYDEKGSISGKGSYKAGNREGEWNFYFPNGNLEQKGVYKNGKPEGEWIWYYENGKIRRHETFYQGKEDGEYCEFDILGDTLELGTFVEGEKTGLWKIKNGDVEIFENYSDDQLHGDYKVYYRNDKRKKIETSYLQGFIHGKYVEYYPTGKIMKEGNYMSGNQHGIWRYYSEDGYLEDEIDYSQGEIVKVNGSPLPKK